MRVLWLCTTMFPPLCEHFGVPCPTSCGWMYSAAKGLIENLDSVQLGVLCPTGIGKNGRYVINGIEYYVVPNCGISSYSSSHIEDCKKVLQQFNPDLIHVYGSECAYSAVVCKASAGNYPILVNTQGLASGIARYADGCLDFKDKLFIAPLDFYRGSFSLRKIKQFQKRGRHENYVIKSASYIVGRTRWDKAHVLSINPSIKYYHLNETLRDSFYEGEKWSYDNCDKHRIFVSNSNEPLKGTHQIIKALPLILREFPDVELYIVGADVINYGFKQFLHFTGYQLYLQSLIKRLNVQGHVHFLGTLSEHQMRDQYVKANVYVLPSSVENSSNSLSEAQLLGVPVIASFVGGTPSMIDDGQTGYLYRYDDTEELAYNVINVFNMKDNTRELSNKEAQMASVRHDRKQNAEQLVNIYNTIFKQI